MNRILIVGNLPNQHLIRLICSLKLSEKTNYELDGFSFNMETNITQLQKIGYKNVYILKKHFSSCFYACPKIRFLFSLIDFLLSFRKVPKGYDLINIHFLTIESFFLYYFYRRKSSKIMISPWGSDVYRIPRYYLPFFRFLYKKVEFVSLPMIKFRVDTMKKFKIQMGKIVNLGFGSEQIDLISQSDISRITAKQKLGLENCYVITCGYNANTNQQHIAIIDAINAKRDRLPSNVCLIFLMTYNENIHGYVKQVEHILEELKINNIMYKTFLSNEKMLLVQKSTDLFIHVQKTDAFSATLQEHILCNNNIINGAWLSYPDLEKFGMPYVLINDLRELGDAICNVVNKKSLINIPARIQDEIKLHGWNNLGDNWNRFYSSL